LTVMALLLNVGLNHTIYYPSTTDMQSSLSIVNSSGSHYTLTAMSYASLMVPFVLAYIAYVWHAMDRVKITEEEIREALRTRINSGLTRKAAVQEVATQYRLPKNQVYQLALELE